MRRKRKTVWAFLDGKKLVDVVQAALDNNMMKCSVPEAMQIAMNKIIRCNMIITKLVTAK